MSRKDDSKAKDAIVTVNIDDFTRTRDSVIMSLATLQSAVSDLSRAYINHANTVLNRGPSNLDIGLTGSSITTPLLENGLLGNRHSSPGAKSEVGEKKKRKRAPHDPNAPKRALTPYFLYMQHNRAQIAQELGANAKPKEVADEGTRRWAEMPEAQKEVWKKLYADNLAVYKEKMKAYKAGLPVPEDDNAKAANQLQQDVAGVEATSAEESEEEEEQQEEQEESSPEPAKEPTPPRSGKRRRTGESIKPVKEASSPVTKKSSPEKKKKAANSKKEKEAEPSSARKSTGGAADSKRSKKKRKSEAGAEE
ncbi:hypothetical protein VTN02DRAFT_1399 [Thermoascus thermophilus]